MFLNMRFFHHLPVKIKEFDNFLNKVANLRAPHLTLFVILSKKVTEGDQKVRA